MCKESCAKSLMGECGIRAINWVLLVMMLILSGAFVIILFAPLFSKGLELAVSVKGIQGALQYWQPYEKLLSALFWITTLYVASHQLLKCIREFSRQGDIEAVNAIISIRKMLDECPDNFKIHSKLEARDYDFPRDENNPERAKCFRYLGTLELGGMMVRKGIIPIEQFNNQFKYRLDNIRSCTNLWDYLNGEDRKYWNDLFWIIDRANCSK